jgi:hypothetical protein
MRNKFRTVKNSLYVIARHELSKILVSYETTPMREAASLQDDLNRAGIKPYAWLINQSLHSELVTLCLRVVQMLK